MKSNYHIVILKAEYKRFESLLRDYSIDIDVRISYNTSDEELMNYILKLPNDESFLLLKLSVNMRACIRI